MRTTTFSVIDHMPVSVREFPKRRAAEIAGLVALFGVVSLTLALLTWSVSDPSLNHATNARIHNLLGAPGAIAADLVMQFIGLASVTLLAPPAFWGWSLLTKRRLERPRLKVALYLVGVIAAAGLASLLPAPGSWPLPTGLGGVVGDAVLTLPHRLLPISPWATIAVGAALALIAILGLAAASSIRGASSADDAPDEPAGKARARALARFDEEDDDDEPSLGMVSIGAVIHALLTAKAALRRMASRSLKAKAKPAPAFSPASAPASFAPWSANRDADDVSIIAAALAPHVQDSAPSPSVAPPVGAPLPPRPCAPRRRSASPSPKPDSAGVRHFGSPPQRVGHALDHDAGGAEENGRGQNLAG